jgi:hypothetical protein
MRQVGRSKQASPHKLHRIGEHEIMLTGQHELPLHQLHHRLYDCFRISLGFAHGDASIVHVGDSAAALASGSPQANTVHRAGRAFLFPPREECRVPSSGWEKTFFA